MIHLHYKNTKALSDGFLIDETGLVTERELLHCVHCGYMWQVQPGSGRKRGYCTCCAGPTCGRTECDSCVPLMKKLGY